MSTDRNSIQMLGLVLAGGKSLRMGRDKSLISYHGGVPHRIWTAQLLEHFCDTVYLSINQSQSHSENGLYSTILDKWPDTGPLGGILSAYLSQPAASWMICSCDMPELNDSVLQRLWNARTPGFHVTCFQSGSNPEFLEPFPAIYEAHFLARAFTQFEAGERSLQRLLQSRDCLKNVVTLTDPGSLRNVNCPADIDR